MIDNFKNTADRFICMLQDEINEYYCMNGQMPKYIMATTRAYCLMEYYATGGLFTLRDTGRNCTPLFRGIEVRGVSGDGYEVFLCGEPIALKE